ncbi:PREDICTED: solute carrier family 35 member C2 isoform X2 [Myotis davidii]|uniref:solute carrier family 35 member C2 isoform X2 n=1 Tax=Myotis davidii TaxID=225400 RepID=UPI000767915F|nr:PREDICTED: solute carrier family 35 member C2 isoform X2 [Myotis davidii]
MGRWALDLAFVWRAVLTLGLVLLYYCFSIGITFYNKWLTKSFHFPLFMTMLHLAVIFLFSALSRALVQCSSHRARVVLSWTDYLRRVAPTALATALDVGLSNWSFLYITVSLYTMTKSSAVLFILIFSLIFKLEELVRPQHPLSPSYPLRCGRRWSWWSSSSPGASSCSPTSPRSSTWRALPWCWGPRSSVAFAGPSRRFSCRRRILGSRTPSTPCSTCSHSCFSGSSPSLPYLKDTGLLLWVLGSLFLGGILAFGLGFSEFLLVSRTSSLTLSIAGIFKEVCTLLLAAHLLGDQISLLNWLGFALCLSGISLHVALKALHSRGAGDPKPSKGLGSNPDLELLLRSSQPEEGDNEAAEEEDFVAQG